MHKKSAFEGHRLWQSRRLLQDEIETEDIVQLSARNKDKEIHIGAVLHRAFKGTGSAGGHATSAGGQIRWEALVQDIDVESSEGQDKVRPQVIRRVEDKIF